MRWPSRHGFDLGPALCRYAETFCAGGICIASLSLHGVLSWKSLNSLCRLCVGVHKRWCQTARRNSQRTTLPFSIFLWEVVGRSHCKFRWPRELCHFLGASLWETREVKEMPAHFRRIHERMVNYQVFKERTGAALAAHLIKHLYIRNVSVSNMNFGVF